jgi:hypothetical protein
VERIVNVPSTIDVDACVAHRRASDVDDAPDDRGRFIVDDETERSRAICKRCLVTRHGSDERILIEAPARADR